MRLRFIVLFLMIVLPIANVFGATFVVSSNQVLAVTISKKVPDLVFMNFRLNMGATW